MSITIFRCLKKPGFIDRARMYFLELNDNGLYMIALGKATAVTNVRSSLQQVIAAEAINYFQDKYEPEIVANEKRIAEGQLETMKSEKHCCFLTKSQVKKNLFPKKQMLL